MPELESAKRAYASARDAEVEARRQLQRATENVKRLERAVTGEARFAPAGRNDSGAASKLQQELAAAKRDAEAKRRAYNTTRDATVLATAEFAAFTDPTKAVERMPDDAPIALFPLRLETRFRIIDGRQILCVRVFPDDALVDTYQSQISQAELDNVVIYWTQRWRAGGVVAGHRAAWAQLVRAYGSGRAKWLTEQVAPLNPQDEPAIGPNDHVLVVRPPSPLPVGERSAIATFWSWVWSSSGAERDDAFDDLVSAVGKARAEEIETTLEPVNLRDASVKPDPSITPVVAFLDLPDPATLPVSQNAWTEAAHAWLLPERLVLLGFRGHEQVLQVPGEPIPPDLQVGPDPSASDDEQIKADGADLEIPAALRWTVDFDEAVAKGMAFRVDLTASALPPTFDRLFVLGLRLGSDSEKAAAELGTLIAHHQSSRKGFTLLPQGRATNNTDGSTSAHTWWENPDESFHHYFEIDPADDPGEWEGRKDGAWLAGMLGVPQSLLRKSVNYYGTDQAEARAMNAALWPATLGYYMEQMLEPVFSEETVLRTRDFFNRFVIGRGTVPLVRIGRQPYGILPATVWSRIGWWTRPTYERLAAQLELPDAQYLTQLHQLTERAVGLWRILSQRVSNVGAPGPDPQQTLLDIVGLHPTSAEFYQRWSQSFTQYYNLLGFETEPVSAPVTAAARTYVAAGLAALADLGWAAPPGMPLPPLLEKIFLRAANLLKGDLVDVELSDTKPLRVTRADGRNYIDWLQFAARTSHDTLRKQEGFGDDIPTAILYLFLHHALDLGYIDTDLGLRRDALHMSDDEFRAQRKEPTFIQVGAGDQSSRWQSLYRPEPAVTNDPLVLMGDFIPSVLLTRTPYLNTQLTALDALKVATTGALERAFVEHLDCLSYRMDAWRLGIQNVQLAQMRGESSEGFSRGGTYVGAYGWLENVHAKDETLEPVELDDELSAIFDGAAPLVRDSTNFGHIHAPSLDQAVTAAVLRNGFLANATPESPDLLAVDLSSERVRWANAAIDGIRNGQSLGALLGYRLERSLHDEPSVFLDELIYDLRRAFPLAGNRNQTTKDDSVDDITLVEARNVVDGVLFADHLSRTGATTYPYALTDLPSLDDLTQPGSPPAAEIGALVDRCVDDMRRVADAVADLGLAEGVYQLVRGNYDRAAGTLDAFSKGTHPPVPEVATTPRKGNTLTHRVALHLAGALQPDDPVNTTPRAKGEPALAQWLSSQMPDLSTVFARVSWRNEDANTTGSLTPSLADLGLSPVDLFYLVDAGGARDMPGLDDLLIDFAEQHGAPRPRHDALFELEYKPDGPLDLTVFETAPLVRALRGAVLGARPLRPTDVSLQNEAKPGEDATVVVRADKAEAVLDDLEATRAAVASFITALDADIGDGVDPEVARDAARDHVDEWMDDYAAAVRPVTPFGLQAASLTTAVEGRRGRLRAMLAAIGVVIDRWEKKQDEYDTIMARYAALPGTATNEERIALLVSAGRTVSTTVIAPLPALIGDLENAVAALRDALDTELVNLRTLRHDAARVGATLTALTAFLPTMASLDQTPFDVETFRDSVLGLANDLLQKAKFLRDDIDRRVADASDALTRAASALGDKAQAAVADAAKTLLGEAFILLPEFRLSSDRLAEWDNVWANRASLLTHLAAGPEATPFPLDDWLHGAARVRERLRCVETVLLLGEPLGAARSPELTALQFPYRAGDAWLGLRFPDTFPDGSTPFVLDEDKLLYSGLFGENAEIDTSDEDVTYSGLLLDEWVETVPAEEASTGLSFHFDRPNAEAPQVILLVTPPLADGAWHWQDIVDTLHETLDFARMRAVEPVHLDTTALGPLLPAVLSSVTLFPITAALNLGFNNAVHVVLAEGGTP